MKSMISLPSTRMKKVEMTRGKRLLNPMVAEMPLFLLLLLGGVNGLASTRMMYRQQRVTNFRQHRNSLTSLPLYYAIDSSRLVTPQNMTFPLTLSDDGHSIQSLVSTTSTKTKTTRRNNILARTWGKIRDSMKFDKQAIAKMGIDFGLTYNMISNINGSITLSTAWYIASIKSGISPLAPGNWRSLLAAYASLYVVAALIRPFRIALALGATHKMELLLQYVEKRIGCNRRNAIAMIFAFGIVLWLTCCAAGVTLASTLAGVPLWKYE